MAKNAVTAEGLFAFMEEILDTNGDLEFFVGIYDSGLPPTAASTGGSPGFTEFTDYVAGTPGNRPTRTTDLPRIAPELDDFGDPILDGFAVSRARNGNAFIFTSAGSIRGAFWCTEQVIVNGLGTLWGGADFSDSPVAVRVGDSLSAFYTITSEASDSIGSP